MKFLSSICITSLLLFNAGCCRFHCAHTPPEGRLFDGKSLAGWEIINQPLAGDVRVRDGVIAVEGGDMLTGLIWTGAVETVDYELSLEARKTEGVDFFCGLTFPVQESHCTLIVGGWGGGIVGLSCIDRLDASENSSGFVRAFEDDVWYRLRVQVTAAAITVWLDNERVIEQELEGRTVSLRPGSIEECIPLSLTTWQTNAEWRKIRLKKLL